VIAAIWPSSSSKSKTERFSSWRPAEAAFGSGTPSGAPRPLFEVAVPRRQRVHLHRPGQRLVEAAAHLRLFENIVRVSSTRHRLRVGKALRVDQ